MPSMPPTKRKKVIKPIIEPIEELEPITEEFPPYVPYVEEDTITFKRSHFFSALSVLTFFAGIFMGYVIWGTGMFSKPGSGSGNASQANGPVVEAATAESKLVRHDIPIKGFYSTGPADAPITLVEFSDYQCPYCRRWHQQVYKPLLAAYPGKIQFVYRNLPLISIHPDAQDAAEAAMCAGEQNVYWQYHDKLFSGDTLGNGTYTQYAQDLNLNMTAFASCLKNHTYLTAIQTDSDYAAGLGIQGTPTFYLNGIEIVGAQPLSVFKQVIDKELAGEIPTN